METHHEVKDVLSRCDTLMATNTELLTRSSYAQEQIEKNKQDFEIATKKNLSLSYQIAILHKKVKGLKNSTAKWQSEWDKHMKDSAAKSLQLGQIKM